MSDRGLLVAVGPDDGLDDVLRRVREAAGRPVLVTIPDDSALFLTASEFRALKEAADRGRVAVSVRSGDPLRLQLARLLGVDAAPADPPAPRLDPRPIPSRPAAARPTSPPSLPPARAPAAQPSLPRPSAAAPTPAAAASPAGVVATVPSARTATVAAPPVHPAPLAAPPSERPTTAPSTRPLRPGPPTGNGPSAAVPAPAGAGSTALEPAGDPPELHAGAPPTGEDGWPDPPPPIAPAGRGRSARGGRRRIDLAGAWRTLPRIRLVRVPPPAKDHGEAEAGPLVAARPGGAAPFSVVPTEGRPVGDAVAATVVPDAGTAPRRSGARQPAWRSRLEPLRDSPLALAATIAGLVALLALAGAAAFFLLPSAAVTLLVAERPLAADVVYDVVADGASLPDPAELTVAAEPVSLEVEFDDSIPTTGLRREPDQAATGTIRFRNVADEAATVEQGTVITSEEGDEFAVAADVVVPPPEGGLRFGEATGEVRAVEPGAGGNLDQPGALGGRLPNGVYFSSRDGPISGGTDQEVAIVAEADLDALRERAEASAPGLAEAALREEAGEARGILPSSLDVGAGRDEFDYEVGEAAETVTLHAVRPVTALAFDPRPLGAEAGAALRRRLEAAAPAGYELDPASVRVAPPVAVEEEEGAVRFRLAAEARARAILGDGARASLAQRLAGAAPAEVEAILADVPEAVDYRVEYEPGWLPRADRMPSNAGRIEIEVVAATEGEVEAAGSPTADRATPESGAP